MSVVDIPLLYLLERATAVARSSWFSSALFLEVARGRAQVAFELWGIGAHFFLDRLGATFPERSVKKMRAKPPHFFI